MGNHADFYYLGIGSDHGFAPNWYFGTVTTGVQGLVALAVAIMHNRNRNKSSHRPPRL